MLEITVIFGFMLSLMTCIIFNVSVLISLFIGMILFFIYSLLKGFNIRDVINIYIYGVLKVKNIIVTLILIGILTALWRSAGTIPFIIYYSSKLIIPEIFILLSFLLCSFVSFLIGTSFGTAATMGSICMTMAISFDMNTLWTGGAVLSGVYFGDRCSPMSTSALLVSEVTDTNEYDNIKLMMKSGLVPYLLTCGVYIIVGFLTAGSTANVNYSQIFNENFNLHFVTVLPAIIILILSFLKIPIKINISISIIVAFLICIFVQNNTISDLFSIALYGFKSENYDLSLILNGGGALSMSKVILIVCISSSYAGIFEKTDLLNGVKKIVFYISNISNEFICMIIISIFTSMISCNQTLAIMLTDQLTKKLVINNFKRAIYLANTVVLIAGTIPWSIASKVPLSSASASTGSIFFAVYLFIVPLYNAFKESIIKNI